jgi:hypothetical protein
MRAGLKHLIEQQLIGVPPAVLEDGEQDARALRMDDQRLGLVRGGRERLVDDDRQAMIDRRGGELHMDGVRGRDHDRVECACPLPQGIGRVEQLGMRVIDRRLRSAPPVGGDDRGHLEARRCRDQRRVEEPSRKSVADDAHAQIPHLPDDTSAPRRRGAQVGRRRRARLWVL